MFAQGADFATYHAWWAGAAWQPWQGLGASSPPTVSGLAAISWSPGRTDVFGIDMAGNVEHKHYG